jgi:integrase
MPRAKPKTTAAIAHVVAPSIDWPAAWAAWLGGRPATTIRARLQDLRALASYLGAVDERAAAAAIISAGPGQARAIVHAWTTVQKSSGVADATVARRLATLGSLCRELAMHGLPWTLVIRRPRVPRYQARACPPWADVLRVGADLERAGEDEQLAALWLLADVGLRRSEVVSLRVTDVIDGPPPAVRVRRKGGELVTRTISRRCWAALRSAANAIDLLEGPIFVGQRGPLTDSGIAAWVAAWGLGSPHALRRAGATELRRRGADANLIRAWLGHASLATTQVYVVALDDDPGRATAYLEASAT